MADVNTLKTNDSKLINAGSTPPGFSTGQIRALIGGYLGWMFDAFDFMVLALAIPFIIKEWSLPLDKAGLVSTATLFGAAFGAYIWGPISDKYGRKKVLAWCLFLFGLFTIICAFTNSFAQLLACRLISGLALGGEWVVGAALVAEYFPPENRARATSLIQSSWPIGYFLVLGIQYWLVPIYGWRVLFGAGALTFLGALYIAIFVHESPAWLKSQENVRKNAASVSAKPEATGLAYIFNRENRKNTILSSALCITVLIAYWGGGSWIPAYLANTRGFTMVKAIGYLFIYNFGGLLGYVFYGYISDKVGRKWNFYVGGFGSAIFVILFMTASTPFMVYSMGAIFGFLSLGYFGPMGAFLAEQFPTRARGLGISVCYASGRLCAAASPFLLGKLAMAYSLQIAIMWLSVFYALNGVIVYFMKETKGTQIVD